MCLKRCLYCLVACFVLFCCAITFEYWKKQSYFFCWVAEVLAAARYMNWYRKSFKAMIYDVLYFLIIYCRIIELEWTGTQVTLRNTSQRNKTIIFHHLAVLAAFGILHGRSHVDFPTSPGSVLQTSCKWRSVWGMHLTGRFGMVGMQSYLNLLNVFPEIHHIYIHHLVSQNAWFLLINFILSYTIYCQIPIYFPIVALGPNGMNTQIPVDIPS